MTFGIERNIRVNYLRAINLNFRYKQFIWGVNNTGVHLGWQNSRVRVMASTFTNAIEGDDDEGYTGNFSLRYVLGKDQR
jgi:hypothetical protein